MRILFLGDVIGRPGRDVLAAELPGLRARLAIDFVVANGENAAGGFGITRNVANDLFATGVDVLTSGNHWMDQREILTFIDAEEHILRPRNYPPGTPGRGANLYQTRGGGRVLVINVMGRVHMEFAACPLRESADVVIVDMHAEATSEKMAMGQFCDGRASCVIGTHSHIPTADAQILPNGTAYQTDAGACADYDSVIGMEKFEPLQRFTKKMPTGRMTPAMGPATLCGVFVETDRMTGLALRCEPVRVGGRLIPTAPVV